VISSLTPEELELVSTPDLLLTKNRIIRTVYELFGELAEEYKNEFNTSSHLVSGNAKISKGENYNGLPYVMLDYPAIFSKADIFAIRSFFWWGHFFSITLHLTGKYQQQYAEALAHNIRKGRFGGWYICRSDDQWQHHFEGSNYQSLTTNEQVPLASLPFIKLSTKIPLLEWDQSYTFFIEKFRLLKDVLIYQAPMR
jgi:hypothetical protein